MPFMRARDDLREGVDVLVPAAVEVALEEQVGVAQALAAAAVGKAPDDRPARVVDERELWSFFSVQVTLRPTQNTSASRKRPPCRTGVSTVIAVALPSTLATAYVRVGPRIGVEVRARLLLHPAAQQRRQAEDRALGAERLGAPAAQREGVDLFGDQPVPERVAGVDLVLHLAARIGERVGRRPVRPAAAAVGGDAVVAELDGEVGRALGQHPPHVLDGAVRRGGRRRGPRRRRRRCSTRRRPRRRGGRARSRAPGWSPRTRSQFPSKVSTSDCGNGPSFTSRPSGPGARARPGRRRTALAISGICIAFAKRPKHWCSPTPKCRWW